MYLYAVMPLAMLRRQKSRQSMHARYTFDTHSSIVIKVCVCATLRLSSTICVLDYICEDYAPMPRIAIVLPLYSDLLSSAQVTFDEC